MNSECESSLNQFICCESLFSVKSVRISIYKGSSTTSCYLLKGGGPGGESLAEYGQRPYFPTFEFLDSSLTYFFAKTNGNFFFFLGTLSTRAIGHSKWEMNKTAYNQVILLRKCILTFYRLDRMEPCYNCSNYQTIKMLHNVVLNSNHKASSKCDIHKCLARLQM